LSWRALIRNHAGLMGLPDPSFLFAVFDVFGVGLIEVYSLE
jgi:hypothetical protein